MQNFFVDKRGLKDQALCKFFLEEKIFGRGLNLIKEATYASFLTTNISDRNSIAHS
ncbi:protein of unknown function [Cardinium endosymbiont cEper1 of Encarsia pergandiella]|nr:protein of unknown function [Cardinium endosymbiont cEper1 of Encarsia pergandiella]